MALIFVIAGQFPLLGKRCVASQSHYVLRESYYDQPEVLRELVRLLDQNHVTVIWRNLAQELGFNYHEIDELFASTFGGHKVCLEKMLEIWLNWAPPNHEFATIQSLLKALRSRAVAKERLAYKMENDNELKQKFYLKSRSEDRNSYYCPSIY